LDGLAEHFGKVTEGWEDLFQSGNHNVAHTAQQYVRGLVQAEKRNMERMTEAVPDSDYHVLQNFLTHSSWDYRPVMIRVGRQTGDALEGPVGTGLFVDESAIAKKGDHSVGVARQWDGRHGKEDNCQVGVFAALGKGDRVGIVDARLFLPKEWTEDRDRCNSVGVPRADQIYRTKPEIAAEIVRDARKNGLQFEWVGADALYGHALHFLESVQAMGEVFLADIHSDRHIYLKDPAPYLPPQGRGRMRVRYHSDAHPVEVRRWVKKQPDSRWQKINLREATKGDLVVEVLHERIWIWDKQSEAAHCWHLIVRRETDSPSTIKYSLSNAPEGTKLKKLVHMQAQRFWIERAFQDAKSHLGMAQYQARGWDSWHRHMALVMLAMHFMLTARLEYSDEHPLLSCYDIQILLAKTLPDRRADPRELFRQMVRRHQQRQDAIDSGSSG